MAAPGGVRVVTGVAALASPENSGSTGSLRVAEHGNFPQYAELARLLFRQSKVRGADCIGEGRG